MSLQIKKKTTIIIIFFILKMSLQIKKKQQLNKSLTYSPIIYISETKIVSILKLLHQQLSLWESLSY